MKTCSNTSIYAKGVMYIADISYFYGETSQFFSVNILDENLFSTADFEFHHDFKRDTPSTLSNKGPYATILNIDVPKDARRKGIGTELLKLGLKAAKEFGCKSGYGFLPHPKNEGPYEGLNNQNRLTFYEQNLDSLKVIKALSKDDLTVLTFNLES